MNLVKIGQVVLNFDQVTYIKDTGTGSVMVELVGNKCMDVISHADELRTWLASHVATPAIGPGSTANPTPGAGGT